jgi:hypothetical protein
VGIETWGKIEKTDSSVACRRGTPKQLPCSVFAAPTSLYPKAGMLKVVGVISLFCDKISAENAPISSPGDLDFFPAVR